jgi:medium-chain acyl-[acyl-carrier-protein] hydrolase
MSTVAFTESTVAAPAQPAPAGAWLRVLSTAVDARVRIVCFPYAGGGPPAFRGLSDALTGALEVLAVEPPGRGTRIGEAPVTRLEPTVAAVTTELEPFLDRPVAFFGHSLGALVAFEVVREMRRRRLPRPIRLFASAARAPHRPCGEPLHELPDDAFLARIGCLNGTPAAVLADRQLMELLLPALRADFAAAATYRSAPGRPIATPITALGGRADAHVSHDDLQGWAWHTRGGFDLRTFEGDHFFLHSATHELAQAITATEAIL